jgi:hypothetical protein
MRTTSTVFLAVGFVLTAVGAWWNNHSGDGANIGAACYICSVSRLAY